MGCIYSTAVSVANHDEASISLSDIAVDIESQLPTIQPPSEANVWKNASSDDLNELIGQYFDDTDQALEIYALLDRCFKKATLSTFVGDVIISDKFSSIRNKHNAMLARLLRLGQKLDEKLVQMKTRRIVAKTISIGLVTTILITSEVTSYMEGLLSGPVAVVLAVISSIPFGWVGKRVDTLFESYEKPMKDEKKILVDMKIGRTAMYRDLENIKRHVDGVKDQIEGLVELKVHGDEDECSMTKRRVEEARESVEGLVKLCDGCNAETRYYRFLIHRKVWKIKMGDDKLISSLAL